MFCDYTPSKFCKLQTNEGFGLSRVPFSDISDYDLVDDDMDLNDLKCKLLTKAQESHLAPCSLVPSSLQVNVFV